MQMKIREMDFEDIPLLAHLFKALESAEWAKTLTIPEIEVELSRRYGLKCASSTLLVSVTDEGSISGYGSVHWIPSLILPGIEGYVSELFVSPAHRGNGIGDSMLKEIERLAISRNCYRLSLLNMKDKESYRRGFYAKRNWEERQNAANMVKRIAK
jgi:GNAT superfamily N-acetyltransferase